MKSSDWLWMALLGAFACSKAAAPTSATTGAAIDADLSSVAAGELPNADDELVIDIGPTEDTAVPVVTDPDVSSDVVPDLAAPNGFSTSFGEIPPPPDEAPVSSEDAVVTGPTSTRRVSARRRASSLFDQLSDDCPPEVVTTQAEIGGLTGAQLACAEFAIGSSNTAPALRNELSLALIANAQALRDPSWAGLVERHLTEVDATNPSLALRLARYHHTRVEMADALRWADVALTHRADWPPSVYERNTLVTHQIRTAAAQDQWHASREAQASPEEQAAARARVVTSAQAWLEYEQHLGRKGAIPTRVCRAAGGDCR